jgi:hypothetical protein
MEIAFTLTAEDLVAFQLHHYAQDARARGWKRFLTLYWGAVVFFGLSCIVQVGKLLAGIDAWADLLVTFGIVATLLTLRWWLWNPGALRRATRKQIDAADPKSRSYYEQQVRLTAEGIVLATPLATTLTDWAAVEKIDLADRHAFIYIAPTEAYVIPERAFRNEGEFHAFVDQARAFHEAAPRAAAALDCWADR